MSSPASLAALAVIALVLAACTSDDSPTVAEPSPTEAATTVTSPTVEATATATRPAPETPNATATLAEGDRITHEPFDGVPLGALDLMAVLEARDVLVHPSDEGWSCEGAGTLGVFYPAIRGGVPGPSENSLILWVYGSVKSLEDDWDITGERVQPRLPGCHANSEAIHQNANLLLVFEKDLFEDRALRDEVVQAFFALTPDE